MKQKQSSLRSSSVSDNKKFCNIASNIKPFKVVIKTEVL